MSRSRVSTCSLFALIAIVMPFVGCDSETATAHVDLPSPEPVTSTKVSVKSTSDAAIQKSSLPAEAAVPTASAERKPSQPIDATFDDIKFEIEPGAEFSRDMLTREIEALAGKRIRIRGYILPTAQSRGIKQFVLVRDNQECCFGPGAALYDCILVEMQPGQTAEFSVRPVAVEGTFQIEQISGPDGHPLAIYRLEGESVER